MDTSKLEESFALESLIALQRESAKIVKEYIAKFKKYAQDKRTVRLFDLKLEALKERRQEFLTRHKIIVNAAPDTEEDYFKHDEYGAFLENYDEVFSELSEMKEEKYPPPPLPSQPAPATSTGVTLPRCITTTKFPEIPLPSFTGNPKDWHSFNETFTRIVHQNPELNSIQKFHYLRTALKIEQHRDIHELQLSELNYPIALELLKQRYDNPRVVFAERVDEFISLPFMTKEQSFEMRHLQFILKGCATELLRLKVTDINDLLTHFAIKKLAPETLKAWEHHLGSKSKVPTYSEFEAFLNTRLISVSNLERSSQSVQERSYQQNQASKAKSSIEQKSGIKTQLQRKTYHVTTSVSKEKCMLPNCTGTHNIRSCPDFIARDCFAKKAMVDQLHLCLNCLGSNHFASKCPSRSNCRNCGQRHHTLLHFSSNGRSVATNSSDNATTLAQNTTQVPSPPKIKTYTASLKSEQTPQQPAKVLLATALVPVVNVNTGRQITLRALIDQCSEGTLITNRAARALGLHRTPTHTNVSGIGGGSDTSRECVSFQLRSSLNPHFEAFVQMAFVMDKVTSQLPSNQIEPNDWSHINGLVLADPTYFRPSNIDLLIGTEMQASILLPDIRIGQRDQPIAQNSYFGWILYGQVASATAISNPSPTVHCHHVAIQTQLDTLIQRFFESEQIPEERDLTQEEKWFMDFFNQNCVRQPTGKYLVRLPLKTYFDPTQTLGRSRQMANNRFQQLERRFLRTEKILESYTEAIHEYFQLNQIVQSTSTEDEHFIITTANQAAVTACVLPHHAVIRESSLTTKLRVVFDASAKTSNGKALNDILCIGPALQTELPAVLFNWRVYEFAFNADVQKMYRCIEMHPDDIPYQKMLWRNNQGHIAEYCLTTVTFGTASAPCTAISVINRIADDERERHPLAENVLKREMYVDDVQSGGHSVESALNKLKQVKSALQSAGMELRKWSANHPSLLASIPLEHRYTSSSRQLHSDDTVKTLGMNWQPNEDLFKFQLRFDVPTSATRRTILSTTVRLFDPLGLIAPIIVIAKIILKQVWACNHGREHAPLGWDDKVSGKLNEAWAEFTTELPSINEISVPRWIKYSPRIQSAELHTFCDGSSVAFAACVYIRITEENGNVHTQLLTAKSKTTPTKPTLTIPRIELCAAELATRIASWAKKLLKVHIDEIPMYFWSDAMVVLHWIHGDTTRWKVFVANRVSKIQSKSAIENWSHVDTKNNPADCATRGLLPKQLSKFDLWWNGPTWLRQSSDTWPTFHKHVHTFNEEELEAKSAKVHVHVCIKGDSILYHYSSLTKLIRISAWIYRFLYNSLKDNRAQRKNGPLQVNELHDSLIKLIKLVQQDSFASELSCINSNDPLPAKSTIRGLAPFVETSTGLLRVGGRLHRSTLPYRQKHPIIVPSHHHFTNLLIDNAHNNSLHGGVQLTLTNLRQQYWIVRGRQRVAARIRKCITCFRNKPEISNQMMGNLPFHRINQPTRPFEAAGTDYTGAFELKSSKFRGNTAYKGYIVIFICLATKAVHLEVVTGRSTELFLMALHRFIGRRGLCRDIFSDNGTNFIGADNILNTRAYQDSIERDIVPKLAEKGIQWHFNPPHAPNFGGLWEANVKSIKYHLKRVVQSTRLTYEELTTVLIRIEACLNSRPLCPLTADPDDLEVLTPGHFLIGDALLAPPPERAISTLSLSSNYIALQRMIQQFWSRWSSDWLSHLQNRPKWQQEQHNIEVNDLVLIKDDRLAPNDWARGRVIEVHPGSDALVRVVTLKTKDGTLKRPVSKLCLLPIRQHNTTA